MGTGAASGDLDPHLEMFESKEWTSVERVFSLSAE